MATGGCGCERGDYERTMVGRLCREREEEMKKETKKGKERK